MNQYANVPARGELHGVGDEVDQHLAQARTISQQQAPGSVRARRQRQPFLRGLARQQRHGGLGQFGRVKRMGLELDGGGLQLGEIQHVVDHTQQRLACVPDQPHLPGVGGVQVRRLLEQARETDDGVQGCAQFVGHVGEEVRLHRQSRLGVVQRPDQFALQSLALTDDPRGGEQAAAAIAQPSEARLDPDFRAVLVDQPVLRRPRVAAGNQPFGSLPDDPQVVRVRIGRPRQRQNLADGVAERPFHRRRCVETPPVGVPQGDHVGLVVGQQAVERLALARALQGRLGLPSALQTLVHGALAVGDGGGQRLLDPQQVETLGNQEVCDRRADQGGDDRRADRCEGAGRRQQHTVDQEVRQDRRSDDRQDHHQRREEFLFQPFCRPCSRVPRQPQKVKRN